MANKLAPCPICEKPATPEHAPFCSDRCSKQDLHKWLTGSYAIPTQEEMADNDNEGE